jgi:hypothetical protein
MSLFRSVSALTALATVTFAVAACAVDSPTQSPMPSMSTTPSLDASNAHGGAMTGTTAGWEGGRTVTFFYSKPFFCKQPPTSGATSECELGADGQVAPRSGPIPVLYVLVPLGFTPATSTLQCPEAGNCIDHPSTIDLSRVFGAGTENAALPPHSHVIGDEAGASKANGGWWDVEVIGVTSPASWQTIVDGKSLETVRALQANAASGVTGDIPTNLDLFFSVRP